METATRSVSFSAFSEPASQTVKKRSDSVLSARSYRKYSFTFASWNVNTDEGSSLKEVPKEVEMIPSGQLPSKEKGKQHDKISNLEAMIHLLKGNIGPGILAIPQALKNAGLALGSAMILVLGSICVHCMYQLLACTGEIQKQSGNTAPLSYSDVAGEVFERGPKKFRGFAKYARFIIKLFLCITQLGFCCVYFVFVSTSFKKAIDYYTDFKMDVHLYMLIMLPCTILLCCIRDLKTLAPASIIANVLQFSGLIIVFYNILQDIPSTSSRKLVAEPSLFPLYFGTIMYAFEGIGLVMPIENTMKNKSDFYGLTGVLSTGMVFVTCLYCATGFYGYLKYGDDCLGSITLNLQSHPVNTYASIAFAISVWLTYPIQFYVAYQNISQYILPKIPPTKKFIFDYVLRASLVIITFILAEAIPHLNLVIALVGAVGSTTLAMIFPPVLETLLFWPNRLGKFKWKLVKNIFILTLSVFGFLAGSYSTIREIL